MPVAAPIQSVIPCLAVNLPLNILARERLQTLDVATIILSILTSCDQEPETKNILFILADDYGYNDMSFRNSSFYETINIDRLAKESMVFNNGYATSRVCSLSRASILMWHIHY